jgi:hypothetical protein
MPQKAPPSRDREQRKVRPVPAGRPIHTIRRGTRVETPRGLGKIVDCILGIGEWEDGNTRLMPPQVVVELHEPWEGSLRVTTLLQHCKLPGHGKVFRQPVHEFWPDQVHNLPSRVLRPTTEPKVKISQLIRMASGTGCPRCSKKLGKKEKYICSKCKGEIQGILGEDFYDPNGPQWFMQIMTRYPIVRFGPNTTGPAH